jgi:hypothetical protein
MKPNLTNFDPYGYREVHSHISYLVYTAEKNISILDLLFAKMSDTTRIFSYPQIPEDKRQIMVDKLSAFLDKNKQFKTQMESFKSLLKWKNIHGVVDSDDPNRFLKKSYFRRIADHGGLDVDVENIKKQIELMDTCYPRFEKIQQSLFVEPALRKYYAPLGYKYNEFVEIHKEMKEVLKWYLRLIQLGY